MSNLLVVGQSSESMDLRGNYIVISTDGLNMRICPGLESNIMEKIPFGARVEVIVQESFGIDTIGAHAFKLNPSKELYESKIIGNWVEIKYQDEIGYLFDAYLHKYPRKVNDISYIQEQGLNGEYVILFPGSWCNYNFWYDPEFEWLGCYQKGASFQLKEVELSFFKDWDGEYNDIAISTKDNKDLLFILGSKSKITSGELKGKYNGDWWSKNFNDYDNIEFQEGKACNSLVLTKEKKEHAFYADCEDYYSPSGVIWKGDIDQDGFHDYIIHYGEKSGKTYFYLSSEAEENELVKAVAVFFSGYCC